MTLTSAPQIAEQRISLQATWKIYRAIADALGDRSSPRLAYYHGRLELMAPLEEHENRKELIGQFVEVLVEELDLTLKSMGSTTLDREDLEAGAEPNSAYYIANEPQVRGKKIDLSIDPAPDLVIEVDITHTDVNKNALYATLGVPEFWRYNGKILKIYQLEQGQYREVPTSPTFPTVSKEQLYQFLQDCAQHGETEAKRSH
jgi:Uma2 family endonuclease